MLIIFLDIEATGLDANKHCALDIAFKIMDGSSGEFLAGYQSLIKPTLEQWEKRDPISMGVNGITWDQVVYAKNAFTVAQEIINIFQQVQVQRGKAAFLCQNPTFDRAYFGQIVDVGTQEKLNWPYHWLDLASMYWALLVKESRDLGHAVPKDINLSKNEIAKRYHLPPETDPHRAMNGVDHLITCYEAVLDVHFKAVKKATI